MSGWRYTSPYTRAFLDPLNHCSFIWIVHDVYPFSLDIRATVRKLKEHAEARGLGIWRRDIEKG